MIVGRGTSEAAGTGNSQIFVNQISSLLPGSDASAVVYPADLEIPYSPDTGTQNVISQVTAYAQACPNTDIVLIGYSQGAQIIAGAISGGGVDTEGPYPPTSVSAPLSATLMEHGSWSGFEDCGRDND